MHVLKWMDNWAFVGNTSSEYALEETLLPYWMYSIFSIQNSKKIISDMYNNSLRNILMEALQTMMYDNESIQTQHVTMIVYHIMSWLKWH